MSKPLISIERSTGGNMQVLAIDLGSSSARVMLVDESHNITELDRFSHSAFLDEKGNYRWKINELFDKVVSAVDLAIKNYDIASIGICSWGVDYGVIKKDGFLLDAPYCYRDERNILAFDKFYESNDKYEMFSNNGIFPLAINTAYQLIADKNERRYENNTVKIALIADLLAYRLTGNIRAEISNASTTQLLDKKGENWDIDLIEKFGIDKSIFPQLIKTGDCYGSYCGVKVIAVGTHDTASAIYAMGELSEQDVFLSSGSWLLLGKLIDQPLLSKKVFDIGYTNERVCDGKVSLLINLNGLFVIQRVVAESGTNYKDIDENIANAIVLGTLDTDKLSMQNDMLGNIKEMLGGGEYDIYDVAKTVYYSLAVKLSVALADLENITRTKIKRIVLSGGASKAKYFLDTVKELANVDIKIFAGEGAVLGNAMRQFAALKTL